MFHLNLKRLRKENKLTQLQLAQKLSQNRYMVENWERNLSEPNIEMIVKLKYVLNCSYEELLEEGMEG